MLSAATLGALTIFRDLVETDRRLGEVVASFGPTPDDLRVTHLKQDRFWISNLAEIVLSNHASFVSLVLAEPIASSSKQRHDAMRVRLIDLTRTTAVERIGRVLFFLDMPPLVSVPQTPPHDCTRDDVRRLQPFLQRTV